MWNELIAPQTEMNWATTTREPQGDLDRSAFLNLLITQLRHQDPLNPMDDRDFIAQMAQFSTLEQMMNLNNTFERTQAFGMIGKVIDAEFFCQHAEEWIEIDGRFVTAVRRQGDTVFLVVIGEDGRPVDVPFDAVREVSEDFFVTQQLFDIFANINAQRATELIGRYVQAITTNGDAAFFVEGEVTAVKLAENGRQAVLVVGNREVFLEEVFSVSEGPLLLGSTAFIHGDRLASVDLRNNRAYLVFENPRTPAEGRVRVQRINHVIDALAYVGNFIDDGRVSGYAREIEIRGAIPFLNVYSEPDGGDRVGQIDFLQYLVERSEWSGSSGSAAATTHPHNAALRNSMHFTNGLGSALTRVETQGSRVYLVFDGTTGVRRVHTQHIDAILNAHRYASEQDFISFGNIQGYARMIHVVGDAGVPHIVVFDAREGGAEVGRINFLQYLEANSQDDPDPTDGDGT